MLIPSCKKSASPSNSLEPADSATALRGPSTATRALQDEPALSLRDKAVLGLRAAPRELTRAARSRRRRRPRRSRRLARASRACHRVRAQALPQLVHAVARIADHRDLEDRAAGTNALADRPLLDVVALDGRFSRIAPGSTPTESRCSFETNRTSRFGGFACAQPSRPCPTIACVAHGRPSGRSCARVTSRPRRSSPCHDSTDAAGARRARSRRPSATFSDSAPGASGIVAVSSQAATTSSGRPSRSAPST